MGLTYIATVVAAVVLMLYSPAGFAQRPQHREHDRWFLQGRKNATTTASENPPANIAGNALVRAQAQKLRRRDTSHGDQNLRRATDATGSATFVGSWKALGPAPSNSDAGNGQDYGNVTGRVTALAVDPADPTGNTVYAGTAFGGVWRSKNAAVVPASQVAWKPLLDTAPTLAVGALALQPGNSNVMVVGTGESNSSLAAYYGLGILRSADAGTTWTLIPDADGTVHPLRGLAFGSVAFSTDNPSLVLAAASTSSDGTTDGGVQAGAVPGLYASSDAGLTWSLVELLDAGVPVLDASATSVVFNGSAHAFFAVSRQHGFYISTDGYNWSRLPNQPGAGLSSTNCPSQPAVGVASTCPLERGEVAVVGGRNEMYAWYISLDSYGNSVQQGFYVTLNSGSSWTQLDETGFDSCGDLLGCGADQGDYNLSLSVLANGSATDIYAGAVNLFRCTVVEGTHSCLQGTWLNLTHALGCSTLGAPAKVHPGQHAAASLVVSGKAVFYFGNDGGVYRALDGYSGLNSTSCTAGANAFDNLNSTLGPLAEINSFAQDSANVNILLAGTAGNGTLASATATSNPLWTAVNSGDGGITQINPSNGTVWYTSNPGVAIEACGNGAGCRTSDFQSGLIVDSATLGGDVGGYLTPYLLDPQATTRMMVGTCRVWRGNSTGTSFAAVSLNLETGTDAACLGNETQVIRELATGGSPVGSNGSPVIYAITQGGFNGSEQVGGKVWVAEQVTTGIATFVDVTGSINPGNYPLGAVTLDPADATGATVYVGVMGFGVAHVWKTVDFGAHWTDFSGSGTTALADVPVNALLLDSFTGLIYAGTDAGLFQSDFTGGVATGVWSEAGPIGGPFLPNSAVTQLRLFDSGGLRRLRVGTAGRGVWELDLSPKPDFSVAANTSVQTVTVGQSATLSGVATSIYGYNSSLTLTCVAANTAPPGTCNVTPKSLIPASSGAAFTVSASNPTSGDFSFNVQGKDSSGVLRSAGMTLHVTDLQMSAPAPASITLQRPASSVPILLTLTSLGALTGSATLVCGGLPTGATCAFSPSGTISLTPGVAVNVVLTVSVANTTPLGSSSIALTASLVGSSITRTQSLALTVGEGGDFALSTTTGFLAVPAGKSATATASVSAIHNFSPSTTLNCSSSAAVCSVSPTTFTQYPGSATVTLTTVGLVAGSYPVTLTGSSGTLTHSLSMTATVTDFSVTPSATASSAIFPGSSKGATFTLTPLNQYAGSVNVSCDVSAFGSGATCSLDHPNPISLASAAAGGTVAVTATVSTPNSITPGSYTVTLNAVDSTVASLTHSTGSQIGVTDYQISPASGSDKVTVVAGQQANFTVDINPATAAFAATLTFQCSGLPATTKCLFSPNSITLNGPPGSVVMTVTTLTRSNGILGPTKLVGAWFGLFGLWTMVLAGYLSGGRCDVQKRHGRLSCRLAFVLTVLLGVMMVASCGGGGSAGGGGIIPPNPSGTPAGSYPLTITATANANGPTLQHTANVTLVVQ